MICIVIYICSNSLNHSIRLTEDSFGDPFWKSTKVREVRYSDSSSQAGTDSVIDSLMDLPETLFSHERAGGG